MAEDAWRNFEQTGSIRDYLEYRKTSETDRDVLTQGRNSHGTECDSDRYDPTGHARG